MGMRHLLWLMGMVVCAWIARVHATCECAQSHLQDRYCKVDFVIKVNVIGSTMIHKEHSPYKKVYTVAVKTKFKAEVPAAFENMTHWNITTPPMKKSCGVSLKRGRRYLIAGKMYKDQPYISICDFISEWKNLSPFQKKGVKGMYKKHCKCQIYRCQGRHEECKPTSFLTDRCYWNSWMAHPNDCFSSHSMCYKKNGVCRWRGGKKFKTCLKEKMNSTGLKHPKKKKKVRRHKRPCVLGLKRRKCRRQVLRR